MGIDTFYKDMHMQMAKGVTTEYNAIKELTARDWLVKLENFIRQIEIKQN